MSSRKISHPKNAKMCHNNHMTHNYHLPKIIACDLDGTLLDSQYQVPPSTKDYFRYLRSLGHILVAATGRYGAHAYQDLGQPAEIDYLDYLILNAGAYIYDLRQATVIDSRHLPRPTLEKLFHHAKAEQCLSFNVFSQDTFYCHHPDPNCPPNDKYQRQYINSLADLHPDENIYHASIDFIDLPAVEAFGKNDANYHDLHLYVFYQPDRDLPWIEVHPAGADKFTALCQLLERHNLPATSLITFGDSANDMQMIEKSHLGVAMANALPELIAVANQVAGHHNQKGVENWLRRYFAA